MRKLRDSMVPLCDLKIVYVKYVHPVNISYVLLSLRCL